MRAKFIEEDVERGFTFIKCTITSRTEKSIQILSIDGNKVSLPRALIEVVTDEFEFAEINIPNWLIEKYDII